MPRDGKDYGLHLQNHLVPLAPLFQISTLEGRLSSGNTKHSFIGWMGLACPCGTFVPGALATLSRYAPLVGIQGTQDVMSRHRGAKIEKL